MILPERSAYDRISVGSQLNFLHHIFLQRIEKWVLIFCQVYRQSQGPDFLALKSQRIFPFSFILFKLL